MELKPGYKQTEVGVVPEDWIECQFKDVIAGFSSGQTPSRSKPQYFKGNIPWITSGELRYGVIEDTIEKITPEAAKNAHLKILPRGTFLIAITGLEAAGTRGSCGIVGVPATTNQSCMALYPSNRLNNKYLFHYYVRYGDELALKYCQGTKQQSYTAKTAQILPIVLPASIEEQEAIATALCDIDVLIAAQEGLLEKKRAIKVGTMQRLLSGKHRLPEFSGEWAVKRLGDVAEVLKGKGLSKSRISTTGRYPCLLYGELFTTYNRKIDQIFSYTDSKEGTSSKVGDILLPGSTTTNGNDLAIASAIHIPDVLLGGDINIIRAKTKFNADFLANYLTAIKRNDIAESTQGITIIHLYGRSLLALEIELPSLVEQEAIVTIISDMDTEITALEAKLEKYRMIKLGMMQNLLTGQVRLV